MSALPLRIGIWFPEHHTAFGGPSLVLLGTILGFHQYAKEVGQEIILLFNTMGDVNWSFSLVPTSESDIHKMPQMWHGPLCFTHIDALADKMTHEVWNICNNVLFPSVWFRDLVCRGLPYNIQEIARGRQHAIWPSGVDVDYFCPADPPEKTQDYFIYFKSQNAMNLKKVLKYFFNNMFGMKGTILTYYNYDASMLRETARRSKFCLMLDNTETQGLAALEIMATDCPLFVCDEVEYSDTGILFHGATSVTNMDDRCGMKSSLERLENDFPLFLTKLASYTPRAFVVEDYSFKAAARRLFHLITREGH